MHRVHPSRGFTAALFAAALFAPPAHAQYNPYAPPPAPGTVSAVGEATVVAKPDLAELDIAVTTKGKTAESAASDNAKKMEKVLGAVKKDVGAAGDVKTIGYLVSPNYGPAPDPKTGAQVIAEYVATNIVRARTADLAAVGRLVDVAMKAGATDIQRLLFTLKNPDSVQAEALKQAATKARAQATAVASALGLRVTGVVSVTEGDDARPRPFAEIAASDVRGGATPIDAGTLQVQARVTVVFATTHAP
jgi:uncharacterized protein YggE